DALRLANEKLADHADALSESNGELQRFAYAVAHDLNEPLRGISTMAEFCLERSLSKSDGASMESLTSVLSSAKRMSRLIADLLTLTKIGHEQIPTDADVDVERVAKLAILFLRKEIDESGAKITLESLPVLRAYESQLVQLFQNLV